MATPSQPTPTNDQHPLALELAKHFRTHAEQESKLLARYEEVAAESDSEFVRYLVRLIADDERRHHERFAQLARSLDPPDHADANGPGVPPVEPLSDPAAVRAVTKELITYELADARELEYLIERLRPVAHTTLWRLLVRLTQLDTEKHLELLRFIASHT